MRNGQFPGGSDQYLISYWRQQSFFGELGKQTGQTAGFAAGCGASVYSLYRIGLMPLSSCAFLPLGYCISKNYFYETATLGQTVIGALSATVGRGLDGVIGVGYASYATTVYSKLTKEQAEKLTNAYRFILNNLHRLDDRCLQELLQSIRQRYADEGSTCPSGASKALDDKIAHSGNYQQKMAAVLDYLENAGNLGRNLYNICAEQLIEYYSSDLLYFNEFKSAAIPTVPDELICPISRALMKNPTKLLEAHGGDGEYYDYDSLMYLYNAGHKSFKIAEDSKVIEIHPDQFVSADIEFIERLNEFKTAQKLFYRDIEIAVMPTVKATEEKIAYATPFVEKGLGLKMK